MKPRKLKTVWGLWNTKTRQWYMSNCNTKYAFASKAHAETYAASKMWDDLFPAVLCGPTPKRKRKVRKKSRRK